MATSKRTTFFVSAILLFSALVLCILDGYYPSVPYLPLILGFIGISANIVQIYSFFHESNERISNQKKLLELQANMRLLQEDLEGIANMMVQKMDKNELINHILSKLKIHGNNKTHE